MAGIYIHIPFCKQKCHYCNFFSIASQKNIQVFINSVLKEIELQKTYLNNESIKSIYFGGGTPSLLSIKEIALIIDEIVRYHQIEPDVEITLEANPDDLNRNKLIELKKTSVNRLSIGIQSFFDKDLKYLNRIHNSEQALRSIEYAKETGFDNLSVDLIYGIPTQSNLIWQTNLEKVISLKIPHLSAYALTVEPKTTLYHYIKKGKLKSIDEELSIRHFNILLEWIQKNKYIHYEISNICKKGFYSKHNTAYWFQEKYLGLGPSAHSFDKNSRHRNIANISKYIKSLEENIIPFEKEILSKKQKYNEYILTSFRTIWGCDLDFIKTNFKEKYYQNCLKAAEKYITNKKIIIQKNKLILTDKGKLFADGIASDFFILD